MKTTRWFALAPLMLLGTMACADVTLLAPGAPMPVIVALGEPEVTAEVAVELAQYIGAMTGTEPEIVTDLGAAGEVPRIVLGLGDEMTPESFRFKAAGNSVAIAAGDAPGLWFGMYALLEELGCRFYFPGDLGENVPLTDTLTLPEINRTESPDFIHRNVWWAYGSRPAWQKSAYADWRRKMKMGGVVAQMGHNLYGIVPPPAFGETHPEYYPLIDGERRVPAAGARHNWQPCTTNPEVIQLAIDAAIKYFDEQPEAFSFSLSPNDGYGWCCCDACVAEDPEEFREYANRGKGRRMLVFANQVAEGLVKKHPDKYVAWYAYAGAVDPPSGIKSHPNVVTVIAHYGWCGCNIHPIEDPDCGLNTAFREVMDNWAKVADKIFVREYFTTLVSSTDVIARDVGAYSLAQDIPYFKSHNVIGVNSESIPDYGAGALNFFLAARLMWDADQPLAPLLDDWYDGLYGPASPAMRSYTETILSTCRSRGHRGDFFTPEDTEMLAAKLDEATALAVTDKQRARIDLAREALQYMQMMRAYTAKPTVEIREQINAFVDEIEQGQRLSVDFVRHRASMNPKLTVLPANAADLAGVTMRPVSTDPMPEDAGQRLGSLRGTHAMAILLERGERLTGNVTVRRLGRYLNPTAWAVLDPDGETVLEGLASVEAASDLDYVAEQAGTYVLAMASSSNACSATIDNRYWALVGDAPHFLGSTPWMYFYVLDGADAAMVSLRTDAPGETGKLTVRDPLGEVVFAEETGAARDRVTAQLPVTADSAGKIWSLRMTGASTGVCEDLTLTLGQGTGQTLSADPSRLLVEVE